MRLDNLHDLGSGSYLVEVLHVKNVVYILQFQLLCRIGGASAKDAAVNIMKRLLSNFVMSHLSMDGHGPLKKYAFRDTNLCRLVVGEC